MRGRDTSEKAGVAMCGGEERRGKSRYRQQAANSGSAGERDRR